MLIGSCRRTIGPIGDREIPSGFSHSRFEVIAEAQDGGQWDLLRLLQTGEEVRHTEQYRPTRANMQRRQRRLEGE